MYQLKNKILAIFLLFNALIISSDNIYSAIPSPKRYLQLINSATESSEFFSLGRINPAIALRDSTLQIVAEAFPNKYGTNEINPAGLSITAPLFANAIQARFGICGIFNSVFNEYSFNAGISMQLLNDMRFGAELEYSKFEIKKSNKYSALTLNFGTILALHKYIDLGISAQFNNEYENSNLDFNKLNIGLGLNRIDNFSADCGFRISIDEPSNFYLRTKLLLNDLVTCRIGYMTNPNTIQAGVLVQLSSSIAFSINIEKSENLPYSTFIQLGINL